MEYYFVRVSGHKKKEEGELNGTSTARYIRILAGKCVVAIYAIRIRTIKKFELYKVLDLIILNLSPKTWIMTFILALGSEEKKEWCNTEIKFILTFRVRKYFKTTSI